MDSILVLGNKRPYILAHRYKSITVVIMEMIQTTCFGASHHIVLVTVLHTDGLVQEIRAYVSNGVTSILH